MNDRILVVYQKWENRALRHKGTYYAEEYDTIDAAQLVAAAFRLNGWQVWVITLKGNGR